MYIIIHFSIHLNNVHGSLQYFVLDTQTGVNCCSLLQQIQTAVLTQGVGIDTSVLQMASKL